MTCMCLPRNTCNLPDYRRRQCRNCSVLGTWEPTARKKGWRVRRSWSLQRISEAWRSRCSLVPCSVAARLGKVVLFSEKERSAFRVRTDKVPWQQIRDFIQKDKIGLKCQISFLPLQGLTKIHKKSHGQFSPHYSLAFSNFMRPISLLLLLSRPIS